MSYFRDFPAIQYRDRAAPNILTRVVIPKDMIDRGELYHSYVVEDGDRPETIAALYYNDPEFDWLVRLANDIYDEPTQWPLTQNQLERYLRDKYTNIESTLSTIDHYTLSTNIPNIDSAAYGALTLSAKKYWVKENDYYKFISKAWNVTPETWNNFNSGERGYWIPKTIYDTEFDLNEQKRFIKLIDRKYAAAFEQALRDTLSGR